MNKRHPDAELFFPDKITVEEFIGIITNKDCNKAFVRNMHNLEQIQIYMFPEEWMNIFTAWKELHMRSDEDGI